MNTIIVWWREWANRAEAKTRRFAAVVSEKSDVADSSLALNPAISAASGRRSLSLTLHQCFKILRNFSNC
jgi:hypothetical protein